MPHVLEISAYLLLVLGAGSLLAWFARGSGWKLYAVLGLALQGALLSLLPTRQPSAVTQSMPVQRQDARYATSSACRSCHPSEYATWHRSYHRSMTQAATEGSVRAPWNGVELTWRERSYHLFKKGDQFWVNLPDPDLIARDGHTGSAPSVARQLVMTTGSHHYQAFWVRGQRGNELWQVPFIYHFASERFLPRHDAFLQPPDAPPHLARWNSNCIQCHAVAGRPEHDASTDRFSTSVIELGIACEACHGPGRAHVRHHQNPVTRYREHQRDSPDSSITNPAQLDPARSAAVCGQCHAYFVPRHPEQWWSSGFSNAFSPGDSLERSRLILDYQRDKARVEPLISASMDSVFFPDGTIRVGGREYNGLVSSPCFQRGRGERRMSCLSCHQLHGSNPEDQLARETRVGAKCIECHEEQGTHLEAHTHHSPESSGSNCYNCHMPYTSYALFKGIRSHRITSPSARASHEHQTPNACNLCHLDKSLSWTAARLEAWYGHGAQDLPEDQSRFPRAAVDLLNGDAATRVLNAYAMGWDAAQQASGTDWQAPLLGAALMDPYAAVRFVAHQSLRSLPGFADFEYDFIAEPAQRRDRMRAARQQASGPRSVDLSDAEIERLIRTRNTTPISISE